MISRNRASPCRNAQKAWLILAKPPARLPIKLDRSSSEDPVGVVAPFALIATPNPSFALAQNGHTTCLFRLLWRCADATRDGHREVGTSRDFETHRDRRPSQDPTIPGVHRPGRNGVASGRRRSTG